MKLKKIREEMKMAKTIKFNLICDDKPVRTIEDLQENFSIEDVLKYYQNGLLQRWLTVRGYTEELGKVSAITSKEPMSIVKELIRIFGVSTDEKDIEKGVYIMQFAEERKAQYEKYEQEKYKVNQIIYNYAKEYNSLVDDICAHPENEAVIKADIVEMEKNYSWVLDLDNRYLFWTMYDTSPLAIMCLLMNDTFRGYYLPVYSKNEDGKSVSDLDSNTDKKKIYDTICQLIRSQTFQDRMKDNLVSFAGITDGYWKDLEPKGKQYMIISMENGDYVRAAGVSGGDKSYTDIRDNFVIIDGIDYKSNNASHKLLYMEV